MTEGTLQFTDADFERATRFFTTLFELWLAPRAHLYPFHLFEKIVVVFHPRFEFRGDDLWSYAQRKFWEAYKARNHQVIEYCRAEGFVIVHAYYDGRTFEVKCEYPDE